MHNFAQGRRKRHLDMTEEGVCGSSASITKVYDALRHCCVAAKIGGRHSFVVIDESKFCHKRKVQELVKQRSRRHLLPITRKHVRTGTQILSECWRAYNTVQQHGYIHYQVNHRTGAHTQHMERTWRTYKENIYSYRENLTKQSL
ncbi:hypothetical protein ABG768_018699 [Culter alburnus]|uniref:ISXO2-like transposase domain-containing protein n=1 Tax=Culter alburnus TaxID=194366 RepID=A0AAW2AUU6_CULAL